MAYVPQGQQSFPRLSTLENLLLVADAHPGGRAAPAARDRQGAGTRPRLLLLDEPTEGIQPSAVAEIQRTILELAARGGLSVLLVEQHVGFALRAAERYHVLEAGRVISSGAGDERAEREVRETLSV